MGSDRERHQIMWTPTRKVLLICVIVFFIPQVLYLLIKFNDHVATWIQKSRHPIFVIVMAQMRTGSTIVGQMFNQNREFFYFFEPLYEVEILINDKVIPAEERVSTQIALLHDMSRCNFSSTFVKIMQNWGGREQNRALAPFCLWKKSCKWSPSFLQEVCQRHNDRLAIKSIRTNMLHIRTLVEEHGVNVRVIHLVRDPRGTGSSRLHYELVRNLSRKKRRKTQSRSEMTSDIFKDLLQTRIKLMCDRMMQNAEEISKNPSWLQDRYIRIRYEDFAFAPLAITRKVYSFLNLQLPDDVQLWLRNATGGNVGKEKNGLFSQYKDSKITAIKWRSALSVNQIKEIEGLCEEAMQYYGYDIYQNDPSLV